MKTRVLFVAVTIAASGCAQMPADDGVEDPVAAAETAETAEIGETYANDDRVCQRIRRTGTHRSEIVCRSRAEIERDSVEGKQTFETLRNNQRNTSDY